MAPACTLAGLVLALLSIPAGLRWRRFALAGDRGRAHFEGARFALALSAAIVLVLMATGRFA